MKRLIGLLLCSSFLIAVSSLSARSQDHHIVTNTEVKPYAGNSVVILNDCSFTVVERPATPVVVILQKEEIEMGWTSPVNPVGNSPPFY
jgi:hypothetical protein